MSMTRTDALTQLSSIRKFEGLTAGELLATEWAGLRGLAGLNPFEFRAGLKRWCAFVHCRGEGVLIPLNSGLA